MGMLIFGPSDAIENVRFVKMTGKVQKAVKVKQLYERYAVILLANGTVATTSGRLHKYAHLPSTQHVALVQVLVDFGLVPQKDADAYRRHVEAIKAERDRKSDIKELAHICKRLGIKRPKVRP